MGTKGRKNIKKPKKEKLEKKNRGQNMASEEKNTAKEEPTHSDIMKEFRAIKKAGWVTPAAFGGSIGLLGVSLQIPEVALSKCVTSWFLIAMGLGFMAWSMYQQNKIKV